MKYGRRVVSDGRPTRRTKGRRGERSSPSLVSTSIGVVRSPPTQRMRGGDAEMWKVTGRGGRREGGVTLALAVLSLRSPFLCFIGFPPRGLAVLPAALLGRRHRHLSSSPELCHQSPPGAQLRTERVEAHLDRRQAKLRGISICRKGSHLDELDLTEAAFSNDAAPWEIWRA